MPDLVASCPIAPTTADGAWLTLVGSSDPIFARLAQARVVPVLTRMTHSGYQVQLLSPWTDYPGPDPQADTAWMNLRLQDWIDTMPAQYFWVHQRFKSRPEGEPSVYD